MAPNFISVIKERLDVHSIIDGQRVPEVLWPDPADPSDAPEVNRRDKCYHLHAIIGHLSADWRMALLPI
jgi:hypothetical protein